MSVEIKLFYNLSFLPAIPPPQYSLAWQFKNILRNKEMWVQKEWDFEYILHILGNDLTTDRDSREEGESTTTYYLCVHLILIFDSQRLH